MAIFNSYVSLPEGILFFFLWWHGNGKSACFAVLFAANGCGSARSCNASLDDRRLSTGGFTTNLVISWDAFYTCLKKQMNGATRENTWPLLFIPSVFYFLPQKNILWKATATHLSGDKKNQELGFPLKIKASTNKITMGNMIIEDLPAMDSCQVTQVERLNPLPPQSPLEKSHHAPCCKNRTLAYAIPCFAQAHVVWGTVWKWGLPWQTPQKTVEDSGENGFVWKCWVNIPNEIAI